MLCGGQSACSVNSADGASWDQSATCASSASWDQSATSASSASWDQSATSASSASWDQSANSAGDASGSLMHKVLMVHISTLRWLILITGMLVPSTLLSQEHMHPGNHQTQHHKAQTLTNYEDMYTHSLTHTHTHTHTRARAHTHTHMHAQNK